MNLEKATNAFIFANRTEGIAESLKAAAPYLQEPIAEPSEAEAEAAFQDFFAHNAGPETDIQYALCQFVRRRNWNGPAQDPVKTELTDQQREWLNHMPQGDGWKWTSQHTETLMDENQQWYRVEYIRSFPVPDLTSRVESTAKECYRTYAAHPDWGTLSVAAKNYFYGIASHQIAALDAAAQKGSK